VPIELAQFIAYVTLTLTGIIVAIVSLRFSYRQNFGWEPVMMVTKHGLQGGGGEDGYTINVDLEFWNRRTYPLVVRRIEADFEGLGFDAGRIKSRPIGQWNLSSSGRAYITNNHAVPGGGHITTTIEAPIPKQSLDNLSSDVTMTATVFDPRRNKTSLLKINHVYQLQSQ